MNPALRTTFAIRNSAAVAGPLLLLSVVLLAGCGSKKAATTSTAATTTTATTTAQAGCTKIATPPTMTPRKEKKPTQLLDKTKHYDVTMVTNCGSFTFRIDQAQSPNTAASFVSLVQKGFFDHTVFHRIALGFVIQGGDPTGTGTGGPGYETVDKPPASADYVHGVVAMAKTSAEAPGTSGSQFFVVTAANANLPPDYAIIGTVTKGLGVVDLIGRHGNASELPTMLIEIEQATVAVS